MDPQTLEKARAEMAEWLWKRIPESMREKDGAMAIAAGSATGPLQQLIEVLATGLGYAREHTKNFVGLVDADTCPPEFLPLLAGFMGFDFPYDLSEEQQRSFVRNIVALYRVKGTPKALHFIAERLIGEEGFRITLEYEDWRTKTFLVRFEAFDDETGLTKFQERLEGFVHTYSPAGMVPIILVVVNSRESIEGYRPSEEEHVTRKRTSYKMNFLGHRLNHNFRLNDFEVVELSGL